MLFEDAEMALTLFHGLGLMALIAVVFGHIQRLEWTPLGRRLLKGFVFGLGALAAMLDPFTINEGGIYIDGRNMFVGFAAAFGGLPAALVAGGMVVAFRLWIGGIGVPSALLSVVIAIAAGLVWRIYISPRVANRPVALALLGTGITFTAFSYVILPGELAMSLLVTVTPLLMLSSVAAAVILGTFLEREMGMIRREAQLTSDAGTDALTGLPNRRAFEASIAQHRPAGGAPLIIDIDRFKSVNDTFGHAAGDKVLRGVAAALNEAVRGSDIVARLGGEEFGAYLPGALLKDARRVAERIRESVEGANFTIEGVRRQVTVSVGAHWAPSPLAFDEMFRPADAALYRAKDGGRNRVEFARIIGAVPDPLRQTA